MVCISKGLIGLKLNVQGADTQLEEDINKLVESVEILRV